MDCSLKSFLLFLLGWLTLVFCAFISYVAYKLYKLLERKDTIVDLSAVSRSNSTLSNRAVGVTSLA
ncbi:p7 protein [Thesium chinense closterovirus 1]|nr:p7 protein [Thesium chinense closterovirus 1]